jgi:hypothetical protein
MAEHPTFPRSDRMKQILIENEALRGALDDIRMANQELTNALSMIVWKYGAHQPIALTVEDAQGMPAKGVLHSKRDEVTHTMTYTFEEVE